MIPSWKNKRNFTKTISLWRQCEQKFIGTACVISIWVHNFEGTDSALRTKLSGSMKKHSYTTKYWNCSRRGDKKPRSFNSSSGNESRNPPFPYSRILSLDLHYYPYKLQTILECKPRDHLMQWQFCEQMLEKMRMKMRNLLTTCGHRMKHISTWMVMSISKRFVTGPAKSTKIH